MGLKLPKITDQDGVKAMLSEINLNCPTGARNNAMILMMYRAGLRISEVCKLGESDVNFKTGMIYIQQSKGKEGKKKDRYVPMDEDIVNACKHWLKFRPNCKFFFCTLDGNIVIDRYLRQVCYRISERAGVFINNNGELKPVNPHALRHTYATELLEEGFDIRSLQELLGHGDINTTVVYTHVKMNKLQEQINNRKSLIQ